jgi:hypothetical protein
VCAKININTNLLLAFTATVRVVLTNMLNNFDLRKILGPVRDALNEVAKGKNAVVRERHGCPFLGSLVISSDKSVRFLTYVPLSLD